MGIEQEVKQMSSAALCCGGSESVSVDRDIINSAENMKYSIRHDGCKQNNKTNCFCYQIMLCWVVYENRSTRIVKILERIESATSVSIVSHEHAASSAVR